MKTNAERYFPLLLVFCALAVRIVYFQQFLDNPFSEYVFPDWDQRVYHEGGMAFAHGNLLAVSPVSLNLFSPLYQYFIGVIYLLAGADIHAVWIAQFLMGTASTLLVYKIANHYFKPATSCIAALLFTFYGGNWFYEGILYREAFITFLGLLSCCLLLRLVRQPTLANVFFSAIALALLMQSRSNNLLMVPVALVYLWIGALRVRESGGRLFAGYLALLFILATPLLLWSHVVRGGWTLYDAAGAETLLGANTLDFSGRGYVHTAQYDRYVQTMPLETMPVIRHMLKNAWEHPWMFLQLYLRKVYYYFNNYEIPVTINFYLFRELAPVLEWGVPFALIGSLGLAGYVLSWRRQGMTLLHAWFLADMLMVVPFYAASRFRLPAVPFLSMFAAHALWIAWTWAQTRRWKELSIIAIAVGMLAWVEKTDPWPEGKVRIIDYINFGNAFASVGWPGNETKIRGYYEKAWNLSRLVKPAWDQSRSLTPEMKDSERARYALAIYHYNAAWKALDGKNISPGMEELRKAIECYWSLADAHILYARHLADSQPRQALLEALQATALSPGSLGAHLTAGTIYQNSFGMTLWAVYHFQAVVTHSPGKEKEAALEIVKSILNPLGQDLPASREDSEQIRKLALASLPPLPDFSRRAFGLPQDEFEQNLLLLYQHLTLAPDGEAANIYYQMGMLYLKNTDAREAAYFYLNKAWDKGIRSPALFALLNNLYDELSARAAP